MASHVKLCGAIGTACLSLLTAPAQAQEGGWQIQRDEYRCSSAQRDFGGGNRVTFYPDYAGDGQAKVLVHFMVSGLAHDISLGSVLSPTSSGHPALRYGVSNHPDPRNVAVDLSGGRAMLDWLAGTSRSFNLVWADRPVASFTVRDISGAESALAACRPIPAPPNRRVSIWGNAGSWIDADAIANLIGDRTSIGPFTAALLINERGRVGRCTVTTSTGIPQVDQHLCVQVTGRGRFRAATDAVGRHIASDFTFRLAAMEF